MTNRILSDIVIPGLNGVDLRIPMPGGLFGGGLMSGLGPLLQILLSLVILVWVVVSLLAGLQIIRSQGNPDQIKEGTNKIKYTWIAVSVLFGFFIVMSIVGAVVGFGSPLEWGNTLAQCGGFDGPFYFSQKDQQEIFYFSNFSVSVDKSKKAYCCVYTASKNKFKNVENSPLSNVKTNLGIDHDGSNWYLPMPLSKYKNLDYETVVDSNGNVILKSASGNSTETGLTSCVELGK